MEIILHRRNKIEELTSTPKTFGVEVDIRSHGNDLIIHHDPFESGVSFDEWFSHYDHGTLILNVKEEGLEQRLCDLAAKKGLQDFFFLDQSFPFLVKTAKQGERRCAVRISEYESIDTALAISDLIDWAWIDCFTRFPLSASDVAKLHETSLKYCLVSPELQGRMGPDDIKSIQDDMKQVGFTPTAVCTKTPDLWQN